MMRKMSLCLPSPVVAPRPLALASNAAPSPVCRVISRHVRQTTVAGRRVMPPVARNALTTAAERLVKPTALRNNHPAPLSGQPRARTLPARSVLVAAAAMHPTARRNVLPTTAAERLTVRHNAPLMAAERIVERLIAHHNATPTTVAERLVERPTHAPLRSLTGTVATQHVVLRNAPPTTAAEHLVKPVVSHNAPSLRVPSPLHVSHWPTARSRQCRRLAAPPTRMRTRS